MKYKKKKKNRFLDFLLYFFILIFLICSFIIVNELVIKPYINNKNMKEAQSLYDPNAIDPLAELRKLNPEIVAWITIPNTVIDYPVAQPSVEEGNSFYLRHDYKKDYSSYGCIFIDVACTEGLNSKNILIHGHSMNNGSMFRTLINYDNLDFYKNAPIVKFDNSEWLIFANIKANVLEAQGVPFEYLQYGFANDKSFLNYIYQVRARSLIDTPVMVNEDDQIITMSTCSYEQKDFRTAVFARKLRPGEDINSINFNDATKNKNPLMPDIYYSEGRAKPNVTDFNTALNKGEIDWYG